MRIPLYNLNKILKDEIPLPGSINFSNARNKIEIPIYRTYGMLSLGNEDDVSGLETGRAELLREQTGTLVFHKSGKDWELEYFNEEEIKYAIERARDMTTDILKKRYEKEKEQPVPVDKKGKRKTDSKTPQTLQEIKKKTVPGSTRIGKEGKGGKTS